MIDLRQWNLHDKSGNVLNDVPIEASMRAEAALKALLATGFDVREVGDEKWRD